MSPNAAPRAPSDASPATLPPLARPAGRTRWIVCALLFFAVVLSYIDRLVLAVLTPNLAVRGRRLAQHPVDRTRLVDRARAQDGDGLRGAVRGADRGRGVCAIDVDRGRADRAGLRRASGFFGQSPCVAGRPVPTLDGGSVIGIGGLAGAIGGMLMARYAGLILETVGSYQPIFLFAACVAVGVIHLIVPYTPVAESVA